MKTTNKLLLTVILILTATTASAATQIRMLKTWDNRYPGSTVICDRFAELLQSAPGVDITVQTFGPESIPPLEQLKPTQNGLFQVLCTYPGFHTGATTLLTGLESIKPDARAFRDSGAMDVIEETYEAMGLHPVAVPLAHGYWIYLNRDLSKNGDLSGMQVRALPPQHPYITSLSGSPVVLPPAEMFSALERGVVDGALFPAAGATGYGFQEVTDRYFETPATAPHIILANAAFWEGLPDDVKKVIQEQAVVLENEIPEKYDQLNAEEHKKMANAGMELITLGDTASRKLTDAVVKGSWAFAATRNPGAAETLRGIIEQAGLLID